jgi:uncharacterized protein (TIGR03067 family)
LLFFVTGLLLAAAPADNERDKLQGTWQVAGMEQGGKKVPAGELAQMKVVIRGNELTGLEGGQVRERFTFTLDATKTPKTIDTTAVEGPAKGETARGIYELTGDTLRICVSEKGKERPSEFATRAGKDFVLLVLKRAR